MQIGITTNTAELIGKWRARGVAIDREQRRENEKIRLVLNREATRILRIKVYSVPIPAGPGGKPRWRRTGNLIGNEEAKVEGMDVILYNKSPHAEFRLLLGTPSGRQIRSPGVQQVDWQVEAIKNRRSWILQVRREALNRALKRR
jgi:hypothetical protein